MQPPQTIRATLNRELPSNSEGTITNSRNVPHNERNPASQNTQVESGELELLSSRDKDAHRASRGSPRDLGISSLPAEDAYGAYRDSAPLRDLGISEEVTTSCSFERPSKEAGQPVPSDQRVQEAPGIV
ncbi:hypothetical protein K3495_g17159, partial [Podosphaera aphanis]